MSRRNAGKRLALIGCGAMGTALGLRLLGQGWEVRVYNRSQERTAPLRDAGASAHTTPAGAVAGADWVATVLTDSAALRALLFCDQGIASVSAAGRRLVDLGTHQPTQLAALGAEAAAAGWPLVEAPMTGSVHDASHGTLHFLVGGAEADVEWASPLLWALGRGVHHLGGLGAGNTAKLALNLLVGVMAGGLGEAIALLRAHGLAVDSFLDALDGSGLASPLYRRLGQRYLDGDHAPRFSLANLEKDLRWECEHALASGLQPRLAPALCRLLGPLTEEAKRRDYSALIAHLAGAPSC
ncbi:NAD(P)-dependent oxidoreductase [Chromobacterium vaccinii]|uniref:NAD(P)-dependent oxidoreductase n=1 Tax=Chromobacterium vaccinii TaxID=1108595 RepID=UPI001E4C1442|nr:NAD(P)-dependent oxidoreductase [Chromobacterium vaccinii]MCD4501659.1 NAD(P)-dependent oxidoreductase [Chromobacterium vaccinii]